MPDRGDERGRGGTRTLVTGILAGTEWHPADNPQEATQTAREARDLAVRLRPVLSKLAQAPRGGRRRDLDWLPAVEQLAVDAQYFASWWLPRLEGKSAQSWPSWSADGYADWVKRLDAQRVRTLEMVQGTTPVTRIASVTQLRRGKSAEPPAQSEAPEAPEAPEDSPSADEVVEAETAQTPENPAYEPAARHARGKGRIMPIRGGGAPVAEATVAGAAAGLLGAEDGSDETHTGFAERSDPPPRVPHTPPIPGPGAFDDSPAYGDPNETHISRTPVADEPTGFDEGYEDYGAPTQNSSFSEPGTFDEYDDGALYGDPNETHISRVPPTTVPPGPTGAVDFEDLDYETVSPATPRIPRTPPNAGPVGFEDLEHEAPHDEPPRVPRTPPFTGPDTFDDTAHEDPAGQPTHVPRTPPNTGPVGPIGPDNAADADEPEDAGADLFFIPRTPPNTGPAADRLTDDSDATHITRRRRPPADPEPDGGPRPLFRDEPHAAGAGAIAAASAMAAAGAVGAAAGTRSSSVASGTPGAAGAAGAAGALRAGGTAGAAGTTSIADRPDDPDEFEYFQPGDDRPPPVFPQSPPTEPVDRARIVRYAAAAVLFAAGCVLVVYAANQKDSGKSAAPPPATTTSSTQPAAAAGSTPAQSPSQSPSASPSSADAGAVTAPTATDTPPPPPSSTAPSKPAPPPPASSAPPSTTSHSQAAPPPSSAVPPPASHPPAASGVSSLSIGSFAPDQTGSYSYTANIHVVTKGAGAVTVTVTMGGTQSSTSPGTAGAQSTSFPLSGKTSYDFAASFDVHGMCPSPYLDVVVTASGASSAVSYTTSPC